MTISYCFSIPHTAGESVRAILVGSSGSVHHVNYIARHFLISYFARIFCDFITAVLKWSFPVGTHSAVHHIMLDAQTSNALLSSVLYPKCVGYWSQAKNATLYQGKPL